MATKRANGEGNIRKRVIKGKTYWEGRYTGADGKQHSVSGKTQSEVRAKLQRIQKECTENLPLEQTEQLQVMTRDMTLNEAYDFYQNVFGINLKKQTASGQKICYDAYVRNSLGHMLVKDITSIYAQQWINTMVKRGLCASSIKQTAMIIQKVFVYMVKERIIPKNPFDSVKYNGKKSSKKRELTDEEIDIFYNTAKQKMPVLCPVITLLLNTGMRIGELIAVTWNDLSENEKYLTINKTRVLYKDYTCNKYIVTTSTPKTETSSRTIPLTEAAYNCIQQIKQEQLRYYGSAWNSDMTIIQSKQHKMYCLPTIESAFQRLNCKIKEKHKDFINITPHYFRHTFASKAVRNGIPELYIKYMCGWSSTNMLHNVYGHVTPLQAMEQIQKYDQTTL